MQPTQHRWWYCNQPFRVKNQEFTYLEADFDFVGDALTSVIRFTDGVKRYMMPEKEFFKKVDTIKFKLPDSKPPC